jgi:hypothetical protein
MCVPRRDSFCRGHLYMKRGLLALRSAFLWILSGAHFFVIAPLLVFLGIFLDPHKHDWLQRSFCRRIVLFSGARVEVIRSPGFDPRRTCFFMVNHVNVFDPFMLYCAIPQYVRGWEQRPRARRSPSFRSQAYVAPHAGRHRRRNEPYHFSGSEAHARWPR